MDNFLKSFLASFSASLLAIFIAIGGIFVFSIIFFAGIVSSISSPQQNNVQVAKNSILKIEFTTPVTDSPMGNPMDYLDIMSMEVKAPMACSEIVSAIDYASTDPNISAIYMELAAIAPMDMAQLNEIREALIRFKTSGKKIYCYDEYFSQKSYLLASVADHIYLNPEGAFEWKGLSSSVMFYKDLLDKLDIKMEIFKYGTFKSAVEPFLTDKMSEANRLQNKILLDSFWGNMVSQVSTARDIDSTLLQKYADDYAVRTPKDALNLNFVDKLVYKTELNSELKSVYGDYSIRTLHKYIPVAVQARNKNSKNQIAVIFTEGEIRSGKSSFGVIGSNTVCNDILKAANDSNIKAVVIRVNSPGGSALASDVMDNALKVCKEKKPVIISMGGVAASGGYYMSTNADAIIASPYTITGSIGVFGMMPQLGESLKKNIGITFDGVKTNNYADMGSITRPMTVKERAIVQDGVNKVYETFINRVSAGRNMTFEQVDSIAQGRVWSGLTAKNIGLVDAIGGLNAAILTAAIQADIVNDYSVNYPNYKEDFMSIIVNSLKGEGFVNSIIRAFKGPQSDIYRNIEQQVERVKYISSKENIQALMPYIIEIN